MSYKNKNGNGFTLLARLISANYIDVTPLPANTALAEWDYKARYVIGNNPVGLMSAVVSAVVKSQI